MSDNSIGIAHIGELLTMIERHSDPVERTLADGSTRTIQVPRPLEKWKPAKVAKFKRLESRLKKLQPRPRAKARRMVQDTVAELINSGAVVSARGYLDADGVACIEVQPLVPAERIEIDLTVGDWDGGS